MFDRHIENVSSSKKIPSDFRPRLREVFFVDGLCDPDVSNTRPAPGFQDGTIGAKPLRERWKRSHQNGHLYQTNINKRWSKNVKKKKSASKLWWWFGIEMQKQHLDDVVGKQGHMMFFPIDSQQSMGLDVAVVIRSRRHRTLELAVIYFGAIPSESWE